MQMLDKRCAATTTEDVWIIPAPYILKLFIIIYFENRARSNLLSQNQRAQKIINEWNDIN